MDFLRGDLGLVDWIFEVIKRAPPVPVASGYTSPNTPRYLRLAPESSGTSRHQSPPQDGLFATFNLAP